MEDDNSTYIPQGGIMPLRVSVGSRGGTPASYSAPSPSSVNNLQNPSMLPHQPVRPTVMHVETMDASPMPPFTPSQDIRSLNQSYLFSHAGVSHSPVAHVYTLPQRQQILYNNNSTDTPTHAGPSTPILMQQGIHHRMQLHEDRGYASSDVDGEGQSYRLGTPQSTRAAAIPQLSPSSSNSNNGSQSNTNRIIPLLLTIVTTFMSFLRYLIPTRSSLSTFYANVRYFWRYYGPFRRKKNQPWYTAIFNRRSMFFLLVLFGMIYISAYAYSCTSVHGCRAWPFGRRPPKPNVPFTIISLLRDMSEESLLKDKSQFVIQWNALISWSMVVPASQILIYMDTEASCRKIMSQPELLGMTCLVVPCWHPEHKRPLLDCIFNVAHEVATTEIIAYVNGDILLHSDVQLIVNQVSNWFHDFLIVSRRTDTLVPQHVLDEFSTKSSQDQVLELLELAVTHGQMHSEFGIDLFAYPKSLFNGLNFPPYLAGVYRWDNWLLSEMILKEEVAVIDATRQGLVVHQEMGKVGHHGRTGAAYNDAIVKARSGLKYRIGNIKNSDYVLEYDITPPTNEQDRMKLNEEGLLNDLSDDLTFRLLANHNASIEVLITKLVNKDGWLAVIPVSHFDLQAGHLSNWLCWADRVNFTSFLFLASDLKSARELHRRGVPVLQFDEAPETSSEDSTVHSGEGLSIGPHSTANAKTTIDNFDFIMFKEEFLSIVLRCGFHFLYAHLNTIWLEDPLRYLQEGSRPAFGWKNWKQHEDLYAGGGEQDFDVAAPGNATWLDSHFLAVRSTQWGKYLWKQIYVCEEANGAILYSQLVASTRSVGVTQPSDKKANKVVDCLNEVLTKFHAKIRKQILPPLLFPNYHTFFVQQSTQILGVMPVVIMDDMEMTLLNTMALSNVAAGIHTEAEEAAAASSTSESKPILPGSVWANSYAGRVAVYKANQIQRWKDWRLLSIHISPSTDSFTANDDAASSEGSNATPKGPITHACINIDPFPLSKPPVSIQAWDTYQAKLNATKHGVESPSIASSILSAATSATSSSSSHTGRTTSVGNGDSPLDFNFKIRIITFDRPRSLARLLDSLNQVDFGSDRITLEVSIDFPGDMNDDETVHNWRLVQTICDSFTWKFGQYSIIHQQQNIGLTGQWTWSWNAPDLSTHEILCVLEDDTLLVPNSWKWMKHIIQTYYLNPHNYDPNLFGFSLQSQHTVLGESKQFRYGSRPVHDLIPHDVYYYRYQLLGTWGTVFFPEHWMAFTKWLKTRSFQHTQGTSSSGFQPCVPTLLSNAWWAAKPKRVWSQWFVRFAFEKGWYSLYTNFKNQSSLVVNFREGGLNFKVARGPMNPAVEELLPEYMDLPPLASLPIYDFHFRNWQHQPNHLKYHMSLIGASIPKTSPPGAPQDPSYFPANSFHDECYVFTQLKAVLKQKEDSAKMLDAELKRLESKHSIAIEQQRRIAEQQDTLASLKQQVTEASSEAQLQAIKRKEESLRQARKEAEAQWISDAVREKAEIIEQHKAKLARQKARREREAIEREMIRQRELAEEEEEHKLEELERLAKEAAEKVALKQQAKKQRQADLAEKEARRKLGRDRDDENRASSSDDSEALPEEDEDVKTKVPKQSDVRQEKASEKKSKKSDPESKSTSKAADKAKDKESKKKPKASEDDGEDAAVKKKKERKKSSDKSKDKQKEKDSKKKPKPDDEKKKKDGKKDEKKKKKDEADKKQKKKKEDDAKKKKDKKKKEDDEN